MKKTLYDILGVGREATPEEITAAYRRKLDELKNAPSTDANTLPLLREAHQILSNASQRSAYDASLAPRAVRAAPEPDDEPEPSALAALVWEGWRKWALGLVVLVALGVWWKMRPAAPVQPRGHQVVVIQRSEVPIAGGAPAADAASAPAMAAAAPAEGPAASGAARSAEELFSQLAPSIARVTALDASGRPTALGSGVVIDRGTVITNCHVVKRGASASVKVGGDVYAATLRVADEELDLCSLDVAGLGAPAVGVGTVKSLRTGQRVYAIGAPQGLELTISDGIVSSLREISLGTVIQTTAPISSGSSGGGLFDGSGQLVGIVTFQHRYGQNLNFAVPADWIGEMRTRSASTSDPVPAARSSSASTASAQDDSPRRLIVGRWWCFGSVSGRNGEYEYGTDGGVLIASSDGLRARGRYAVAGRSVQYSVAGSSFAFAIESLTAEKMVLNIGLQGQRLVCDRR